MALTPAQKDTLKADIVASPDALAVYNNGDLMALSALYNVPASPSFIVWRSRVTLDEIMLNGFDWVRVDNLSIGKARIWEWLFNNQERAINPSKDNIRAGIVETWKGTAADLAVQAAVFGHCKRSASRVERLFVTGTGSDVAPGLLTMEGPLTFTDLIGL